MFKVKGFHLYFRVQVMPLPALKAFIDELASFGINTLVMEWEASFPFQQHAIISNKYAYTEDDVKEIIAYCTEHSIDVIPLQQCFGHVEYILQHDRYAHLREDYMDICQVCPMKMDETKKLFTELFTEVAALHPSPYFHIGGDETYLLGSCEACSAKAEATSKSQVFVDYVAMICEILHDLGKTPVLWADVILAHPTAVHHMPKDAIYINLPS